jgi:hypothetical protein
VRKAFPEVHPTAAAVARLAAPRLAAGEGVDAALAVPLYLARQGCAYARGATAVSAVLKDAPRLSPMREADLDASSRSRRRSTAIRGDARQLHRFAARRLRMPHLAARGELVGYFVLMVAAGEAHLLNLSIAARTSAAATAARCCARRSSSRAARRAATVSSKCGRATPAPGAVRALRLPRVGVRRGYYPAHSGARTRWC